MGAPGPGDNPRVGRVFPYTTSGLKTSTQTIYSGACFLGGIFIRTDGEDLDVTIYDNTSAAGTIVRPFFVKDTEKYGGQWFGKSPIYMQNGIHVVITGAVGASGGVVVDYSTATRLDLSDDLLRV